MTEETPNQGREPAVERLMDAVQKAGVRTTCPSCGEESPVWQPFDCLIAIPAAHAGGEGYAALGMYCTRCGFLRLHTAQGLDQYMQPH